MARKYDRLTPRQSAQLIWAEIAKAGRGGVRVPQIKARTRLTEGQYKRGIFYLLHSYKVERKQSVSFQGNRYFFPEDVIEAEPTSLRETTSAINGVRKAREQVEAMLIEYPGKETMLWRATLDGLRFAENRGLDALAEDRQQRKEAKRQQRKTATKKGRTGNGNAAK